jgi:hypothetical protein
MIFTINKKGYCYKFTPALIYDRILKCKQIKGGIFSESDKKINHEFMRRSEYTNCYLLSSSVFQLYLYFVYFA